MLKAGEGAHVVRVSQTLFGNAADGCDLGNDASNVLQMFATYLDPDTLQETCGVFERDVTPCFQKTIVIGCDPQSNTATINLYVRDDKYKGNQITENPKVGRCKVGKGDIIRRAIKITETFDCTPSGTGGVDTTTPNTCSEVHDNCDKSSSFCNFSELSGYACKPYVSVGSSCEGFTIPGGQDRCNPADAFCLQSQFCLIPDSPGTCTAFLGTCDIDSDCSDLATQYCHLDTGKCRPRLQPGDCCVDESSNACPVDLMCRVPINGEVEFGAGFMCLPELKGDDINPSLCPTPCADDEECAFSEMDGTASCRPYLKPGEACGMIGIPGSVPNCNPAESFCHVQDSCYNSESSAICVAYTSNTQCVNNDECAASEWCDMIEGKCKPTIAKDMCCASVDECGTGLTCVEQYYDNYYEPHQVCLPLCDSDVDCPKGQWCSQGGQDDAKFCKPFAKLGDSCEFFTKGPFYQVCDPRIHFCEDYDSCIIADAGGKCVALGNTCRTSFDCEDPDNEWCDSSVGHCKPKVPVNSCCDSGFKDQCEKGSECTIDPISETNYYLASSPKCIATVCNNQFCGGFAGFGCDCLCKSGQTPTCVDDPADNCDPTSGADCGGVCQCEP